MVQELATKLRRTNSL